MKKTWRIVCVAIFVFGAVSAFEAQKRSTSILKASQAAAVRTQASPDQSIDVSDTEPAQAFVVEFVDSTATPDGTVTIGGTTTRFVKADGEWRLVIKRKSGVQTVYAGSSEGVFEKNKNELSRRHVSEPSSDQLIQRLYRSHNYLRHHPGFVRTDEVAGLTVYVLKRIPDPTNPEQWEEISYSPKTGNTILRSIRHLSDGSEIRREAVTIEFKDVPDSLNQDIKDLPIKSNEVKARSQ